LPGAVGKREWSAWWKRVKSTLFVWDNALDDMKTDSRAVSESGRQKTVDHAPGRSQNACASVAPDCTRGPGPVTEAAAAHKMNARSTKAGAAERATAARVSFEMAPR
jgi:hypothetical protein